MFEEFEDVTKLSATLIDRSKFNKGNNPFRTQDVEPRGHDIGNHSLKGKGKSAIGKDSEKRVCGTMCRRAVMNTSPQHTVVITKSHPHLATASGTGLSPRFLVRTRCTDDSNQLHNVLMPSLLFQCCVEWCGTEDRRRRGVADKDGCHLYYVCLEPKRDDAAQTVHARYLKNRSGAHNIYSGVRWILCLFSNNDPVMDAHTQRCQSIYPRAFWANAAALRYVFD